MSESNSSVGSCQYLDLRLLRAESEHCRAQTDGMTAGERTVGDGGEYCKEAQKGEHETDPVHTEIVQEDNPFVEYRLNRELLRAEGSCLGSYEGGASAGSKSGVPQEASGTESSESSTVSIQEGLLELPMERKSERIQILGATKVSEGQGRAYFTYTIKFGEGTVKRRYSEFESLRKILVKLFPMTLIPPLPEKHTLKSYGKSITGSHSSYMPPADPEAPGCADLSISVINGYVTHNDQKLVRHRIRMLSSFLNRLLQNEEITKTSIISDFLDSNNVNWNDLITSSAAISSLPKNVLQCNPLDPTNNTRAHAYLPIPAASSSTSSQLLLSKGETVATSQKPSEDDLEFSKIEYEYRKYEHLLRSGIYKYNRRITKTFHDLKNDFKNLNELFSEFSTEEGMDTELSLLLLKTGAAYESSAAQLECIVGKIYYNINESLIEAIHMAGAAQELIQYRNSKFMQGEILKKTLLHKEGQLKRLQEQEDEVKNGGKSQNKDQLSSVSLRRPAEYSSTYKGKFINKINKLATIVKESVNYQDIDTKSNIVTIRLEIDQLKESLDVSASDLKIISKTIKDVQLPKFSKERNIEFFDLLKNYSRYMKEFAKHNLEIWEDIKKE